MVTVKFEKTGQFARCGVWNQCIEYIYLSIVPDKLMDLKRHKDYITKMCYEIYPVSDDYELEEVF